MTIKLLNTLLNNNSNLRIQLLFPRNNSTNNIIRFTLIYFSNIPIISADNTAVKKAVVLQAELKNNPTEVPVFCQVEYVGENKAVALIK